MTPNFLLQSSLLSHRGVSRLPCDSYTSTRTEFCHIVVFLLVIVIVSPSRTVFECRNVMFICFHEIVLSSGSELQGHIVGFFY